jgi:site-specific DNA-methyltransferase (adenine-specific)
MTTYFKTDRGALYKGDCLEIGRHFTEEAALVCIDPPYNINKAEWDKIPDYQAWMGKVFLECQRLLADNGSFYWFHNKMPVINRLMIWLEENTEFVFKQLIVWNKRFKEARNKKFLDGFVETNQLRNYQLMVEYCLFYTFQDETGLAIISSQENLFLSLKEYLRDEKQKSGLTLTELNKILIGKAKSDLIAKRYFGTSQWELPTHEMYKKLQATGYFQRPYEELRKEYEGLRKEYESLRYTFNNQKTHHSVWNYEIVSKIGHITPKPVPLIENILKHSSNPGDLVIDLFGGSGTTAVACENLKRRWIMCEKEERYCEIAARRIEAAASQKSFEDYL